MTSKTKIFISRALSDESPLHKLSEHPNIEVFGEPLITLSPIDFTIDTSYEWIFFYSQNAVKYFVDGLSSPITDDIKIGCIGNKTARAVESLILRKADYIAEGTTARSAELFMDFISDDKVLFPRASRSQKSIQKHLPIDQVVDLVVYHNQLKESINIPRCELLVFTSPLNVEAYLKHYKIALTQTIITIGNTTAAAIRASIDHPILVADEPSEESIYGLIKEHLQL